MEQKISIKQKHSFAIPGYLNGLGYVPTLSSQSLGWDNLLAMVLPYPGSSSPLALPAMVEEDEILVQLSDPIQLNVKIGEESFSVPGLPGTFSTAPNYVATTWQIPGPTQLFVMSVKHELLTQFALEVLDVDPKYVNLAGKVGEEDPFIYQVSQMIRGEIDSQGIGGRLFIDSLTQSLVIHLIRKYVFFPKEIPYIKGRLRPRVLRSVLGFIDEYLEENLSLEKIATVANLSTFHFSRLFKQSMNIPVHQYVLQKRLDYGKRLLIRGGFTIAEVAIKAGFADASHFYRHFKRRFGIVPGILTK
ncbi:MAG: AraC family transcriptional regulator [Anaerolineales bacterium]